MCLVEVRVEIEATDPGCEPQVSAFIDSRPDLDLGSELALPRARARNRPSGNATSSTTTRRSATSI